MVAHTVTNVSPQFNDNEKFNLQSKSSHTAYMGIYVYRVITKSLCNFKFS